LLGIVLLFKDVEQESAPDNWLFDNTQKSESNFFEITVKGVAPSTRAGLSLQPTG